MKNMKKVIKEIEKAFVLSTREKRPVITAVQKQTKIDKNLNIDRSLWLNTTIYTVNKKILTEKLT